MCCATRESKNALSWLPRMHLSAGLHNFAGELNSRYFRRKSRRRRIFAFPLQQVSAIQSGGAYPNEQRFRRWNRSLHLSYFQHFGPAEARDPRRSHGFR
jgi:2-polyprenyl-6-methoxyphenol hydroxylase-like FAD-dependent oxidoreductase